LAGERRKRIRKLPMADHWGRFPKSIQIQGCQIILGATYQNWKK
jgi:hypothetical protein